MLDAIRLLESLHSQKLSSYDGSDATKLQIEKWYTETAALTNLCALTTRDARERIAVSISQEPVRTYVLDLCIAYFSYGGQTDDFEDRLVNSLVDGLCIDGRQPLLSDLPPEVLFSAPRTNFPWIWSSLILRIGRFLRLTSEMSLREFLLSNRCIQIVMLIAIAEASVTQTPENDR